MINFINSMLGLNYLAKIFKPAKTIFLDGYITAYQQYFTRLRYKRIRLLEIGVYKGNSLLMWKNFFPFASIVGIDINKDCMKYVGHRINIYIGDQTDKSFMLETEKIAGPFDIVIDDGGHCHSQQIKSFEIFFKLLNPGGLYVIEDLHTSYLFEKNYKKYFDHNTTTVEYFKSLIDKMNLGNDDYNIKFIHFYKSIIFIKKT